MNVSATKTAKSNKNTLKIYNWFHQRGKANENMDRKLRKTSEMLEISIVYPLLSALQDTDYTSIVWCFSAYFCEFFSKLAAARQSSQIFPACALYAGALLRWNTAQLIIGKETCSSSMMSLQVATLAVWEINARTPLFKALIAVHNTIERECSADEWW